MKKKNIHFLCSTFLFFSIIFGCNHPLNNKNLSLYQKIKNIPKNELVKRDSLGRSFLHHATIQADSIAIIYLIEKGIPLDQKDDSGYTPLHIAVMNNNHNVVKMLIENGANTQILFPDSTSLLMYAVRKNDVPMAEILFFSNNNNDYTLVEGNLNYKLGTEAARRKYYSLAEMFIWPLHYIVKRDKVEYFKHLITTNKNLIKSRDNRKSTPLHVAYLYQNDRFIHLLREAGAKDTIDALGYLPEAYKFENFEVMTSLNTLDDRTRAKLDDRMLDFLIHHNWLTIGVIKDGRIAYLRSYGKENMIDKDAVYASVSKPVTSIICIQLLKKGLIRSLDDPISDYSKKYRNVMPEKYANDSITFRHLLTHHSGIPHIDKPLWADGKLNLLFKPGERFEYTTNGYSLLGEVLEEITGESFSDLVKEYIGQPINAESFWAEETFRAPAARIHSTTRDFARFAEAFVNHKYLSESAFYDTLIGKGGYECLGWGNRKVGTDDLTIEHSGSNGKPRAHILVKPKKKLAIVLMGETKSADSDIWFLYLAPILMDIMEEKGYY
jgi:CubicO group peptidase (beta-lactamase class C family)